MIGQSLSLPNALDVLAIIVGSLTGALHATRKQLGLLGVIVVAFCTGVGGGAIRDTILLAGTPGFLLTPEFMACACGGAVLAYFFARAASALQPAYVLLDALMIGIWVLLGCTSAQALGLGDVSVVFVGVVAATGGGLLRDVLCHNLPSMVTPGVWYSPAAFFAAVTWVGLEATGLAIWIAQLSAMVVATSLRLLSLRFGLYTPQPVDVSDRVLRVLRIRTLEQDRAN